MIAAWSDTAAIIRRTACTRTSAITRAECLELVVASLQRRLDAAPPAKDARLAPVDAPAGRIDAPTAPIAAPALPAGRIAPGITSWSGGWGEPDMVPDIAAWAATELARLDHNIAIYVAAAGSRYAGLVATLKRTAASYRDSHPPGPAAGPRAADTAPALPPDLDLLPFRAGPQLTLFPTLPSSPPASGNL